MAKVQFVVSVIALAAAVDAVDCNVGLGDEYLWGVNTCKAPVFKNKGSMNEYYTTDSSYGNDCVKIYEPERNYTHQTCDAQLENLHGNYYHSVMCDKIGHNKCCQIGTSYSEKLTLDPSNPRVICSGGKGFIGEVQKEDFSDCDRLCCPDGCLAPQYTITYSSSKKASTSSSITASMSAVVFLVAAITSPPMVQFVVSVIALAVAVDAVDCNVGLGDEYLWGVNTCKAPVLKNKGSWDEYLTTDILNGNDCVKIYEPERNRTDQTCDAQLENLHGNYYHSVMCDKIGHNKCCQIGTSYSENLTLHPSNPRVICSGGKGFIGEAKKEDFSDCDRLCCPDGCLAPAYTVTYSSSKTTSSSITTSMSAVVFLVAAITCM